MAWFLAKTGAHVTVVERSKDFLAQGQNIDVHGAAITVLKKMGLMDEVQRFNTTEIGTQFISPDGREFAKMPVGGGRASPTSPFEILRGDLANVLYEASKNDLNINYIFNTTITKVLSNDDEAVKVELSDGSVHEFDSAIAADGQWSRLRKLTFAPEDVTEVDKGLFVSYYTVPRLSSDNDWWNIYHALESRVISTRPDPHCTIRAALMLMPCSEQQRKDWLEGSRSDQKTQKELVKREFADAGWQAPRLLDALDSTQDFYMQNVQQIRMKQWSNGRVVCLGDAAYAPTPLTGMGTALAIIGGYLLAGEISEMEKGAHPSQAFDGFDSKFRPFVEKIQNIPSFVPGVVHPRTAWKIWLLQTFVWFAALFCRTPWIAGWFDTEGK